MQPSVGDTPPSPTANAPGEIDAPIGSLKGMGATRAKEFQTRGVATLEDLLNYFPRAYQRERAECSISELIDGPIQIARGEVVAVDYLTGKNRPRFEATLSDEAGSRLSLLWFNGAYLRNLIRPGMFIRVTGAVKFRYGIAQMSHPTWKEAPPDAEPIGEDRLRAVYPASARLTSKAIGQFVERAFESAGNQIAEWFDDATLQRRGLISRHDAYRSIHLPARQIDAMRARHRLAYDEFMLLQIGLGIAKRYRGGRISAPALRIDRLLDERIRRRFSFDLTAAQNRCICDIATDLRAQQPMHRLLQGDVGSGKTSVAVYAMLVAVANRMQAAILAPTEVLAEQHYFTLTRMLENSAVNVELFTQRTRRQSKGAILKGLADGRVQIAIGTQALLQGDIDFANLGLVVVDEQHKLGVRQRAVLKGKGYAPHYLVMTATPIPRTLALSYFADFDVSLIDELPPGRQPIRTRWLRSNESAEAYVLVRREVQAGRQAYVVVPQIDDNGLDDAKSVTAEFKRLSEGALMGLRLAALHGQMPTEEKQRTMADFRDGAVDVLITTTVIEVGIDVANATVIVIENADRFGLSQLHQIRGRVGRGSELSHCVLIADAGTEDSRERLTAMTRTNDGFEIAETDLRLRGPGEFFGTRQHGLPQFKIADITLEIDLLRQAKEDALAILADDPNLRRHEPLRDALMRQFGDTLPLAQVG